MLIVVGSQGKQQAAPKGSKGASGENQWEACGVRQVIEKWGRNCLHVTWSCPAVHSGSSCNPTAISLCFYTT